MGENYFSLETLPPEALQPGKRTAMGGKIRENQAEKNRLPGYLSRTNGLPTTHHQYICSAPMRRVNYQKGVVNTQGITARSYIAGVAMTLLTLVTLLVLAGLRHSQEWIHHNQAVIPELSGVLLELRRLESTERGFLLTRNPVYLERFDQDQVAIGNHFQALSELLSDNPDQQAKFTELKAVVAERQAELYAAVQLGREGRFSDAIGLVGTNRGLHLMSKVRTIVEQMMVEENRLLNKRLRSVSWTFYLLVALVVLYIGISSGVLFQLFAKMRETVAARTELETVNNELEERVRIRTADLSRRTEQLARTNRELERFAYVASHDLQEPLRRIMMLADLLGKTDRTASFMPPERAIATIQTSAARMRELIEGILKLSRLSSDTPTSEPVNLETVVKGIVDNLPSGEGVPPQINVGPLPVLMANPTQLYQLFQNLISNAIKFRVKESCRVDVGMEERPGDRVFYVKDNGIGIEEKYADRIFEVFERLHVKDAYPGSGIGLAICRKIVEGYGGKIWVVSSPGKGAAFYFTLPQAVPAREVSARP
jgi:signal transduction histidine kinase